MIPNLVALVGRPNVGKSTLFNRLSVRIRAIVHDMPGVTRDRKFAKARLGPVHFNIIDTPGLESALQKGLQDEMKKQALKACQEASVILFIVDYISGITPEDQTLAKIIRSYGKHVVLVANKCEKAPIFESYYYKLGFGNPIPISAEHGLGLVDLCESIMPFMEEIKESKINDKDHIRIAIVGRPNTGKSTYINTILNDNRLVANDEAGTTRDTIEIEWQYAKKKLETLELTNASAEIDTDINQHFPHISKYSEAFNKNQIDESRINELQIDELHKIKIIDTAGLRRQAKINENLEQFSAADTISAINLAHIVVLMIDVEKYFEHQDYSIMNIAAKEGRGIVIAVNKCEKVVTRNIEQVLKENLTTHIAEVPEIPIVYCSNYKRINIYAIIDEAINVYSLWNEKISTNKLNSWLKDVVQMHFPPLVQGRRIRFKYITQINTRPPAFKIFTNLKEIPDDYKKYLINNLCKTFGFKGFAIRIFFSQSHNPYAKK